MPTKKTKNKPSFICDTNGGIMVTAALRYSLGRMTYVPEAVQDWIKTYWDDFDSNTKTVVVRDVFEYLYDDFRTGGKMEVPFDGYDIKKWKEFAINRYWQLDYDERKHIDNFFKTGHKIKWFEEHMYPMLHESKKV